MENNLISVRKEKIEKLKNMGINPYPYKYDKTHTTIEAKNLYKEDQGEDLGEKVKVAGRIMSFRRQGKTAFAHIQDEVGKIQIYIRKDGVGENNYEVVKLLDIGDIIGVEGNIFKTRTGEITIYVTKLEILTKSVRPIPIVKEKIDKNGNRIVFDAFKDKEERYRKRYLDLILNPEVREVFRKRSLIIKTIREFMNNEGFLEVETPILQPIKGGAAARPFITHHNTLDIDLYLRIAPELYLKRLIVGGFEKVYELGKNFRNEGISYKHNPEFTMMELYQAYADYNDMMDIAERLITYVAEKVLGTLKIKYRNKEIDLTPPWKKITMYDALKEYANIDVENMSIEELKDKVESLGIEVKAYMERGELITILFEELVEEKLINPTFILDYPIEISPLTKTHRKKQELVERFELYINGWEIGNAYSELNDPEEQYKRFLKQLERREKGDDEAEMLDKDFIMALEYGMPPTGGLGIGIDRLIMILLNQYSIRDVILFPQMRPKKEED